VEAIIFFSALWIVEDHIQVLRNVDGEIRQPIPATFIESVVYAFRGVIPFPWSCFIERVWIEETQFVCLPIQVDLSWDSDRHLECRPSFLPLKYLLRREA
jgi:hypothetical protein